MGLKTIITVIVAAVVEEILRQIEIDRFYIVLEAKGKFQNSKRLKFC